MFRSCSYLISTGSTRSAVVPIWSLLGRHVPQSFLADLYSVDTFRSRSYLIVLGHHVLQLFQSDLYSVDAFRSCSYLIVLIYNINVGNVHIIVSWYLKQSILMTATLLSACCTKTVINFYRRAIFFSTACFSHFFNAIYSVV